MGGMEMREIRVNYNVPKNSHHEYIYKDGRKIKIEDSGIRYAYIDEGGLLHITKWEDTASQYGNGVYMVTDDIKGKNGLPEIDGNTYCIWGAGKDWVRISKKTREKFYTGIRSGARKATVYPNHEDRTRAYETLREIYAAVEDRLDEESRNRD